MINPTATQIIAGRDDIHPKNALDGNKGTSYSNEDKVGN